MATVAVATQEKTVGQASGTDVLLAQAIQAAVQEKLTGQALVTSALTADVANQTGSKAEAAKQQVPTVDGKPSSALTAALDGGVIAQNVPQTDRPKGVDPTALGRMMDLISHDAVLRERGSEPATNAVSASVIPNAPIQPPVNPQMLGRETSTAAETSVWGAAIESSDLPESGKEHNSASTEHDAWKEGLPQSDGDGAKVMLAPTASSGSLSAPTATRSASAPAPVAGATTMLPESPLPASVRFEVQPGDMGRIRVHLSVVDHTVYTNVMTERVEAHDFLVKSSERYESGLAAHGLDVGRFHVDVQGQGREQADHGGAAWLREETHRRPPQPSDQLIAEWHSDGHQSVWGDRMVNLFA